MDTRLWRFEDVARYLQVSESKVRHLHAAGKIPSLRIGVRSIRFRKIDIEKWVEENANVH